MISPCACAGSLQFTHLKCLKQWVRERGDLVCEICKSKYCDAQLPFLELDAQVHAAMRSAPEASRAAAAAAQPYHLPGRRPSQDPPVFAWRTRRFWLRAVCVVGLVGALVCLFLFLGMNAGSEAWAAVLLRVLAFSIPLLIIARAVFACCSLHRASQSEDERRAQMHAAQSRRQTQG